MPSSSAPADTGTSMSTAGAVLLRAEGLTKRFPGVTALDGVSIELRAGEVHALVGENGAGKSTLIKLLTGVYRPDAGTITLRGAPVRFDNPLQAQQAGISTIYQEIALVPLMSVARNLYLGREPRRFGLIDFARMHREAAAALRDYGVDVDVTRPLRDLGVGAQQMVALARAADVDAQVVIMDEPTSALEPREVETLFGVIATLTGRGIAVVYVSHRMDELYRVCSAVTVLRDGALVHTGPLAELSRLRLVSLMLGRDTGRVGREGTTGFDRAGRPPAAADGAPLLSAEGLGAGHLLKIGRAHV